MEDDELGDYKRTEVVDNGSVSSDYRYNMRCVTLRYEGRDPSCQADINL